MTSIINFTPAQLRRAADIQERVLELQNELNQLLNGEASVPHAQAPAPRKKYRMSAAGRARIAAAARARWAKIKGTAPSTKAAKQPKRKLSAQGLANIRAGVAKRMMAQGKGPAAVKPTRTPTRKISAAGKARLSALAKARNQIRQGNKGFPEYRGLTGHWS